MERFLKLLRYDQNVDVSDTTYQILKFQLNDATFLNYRPSQIAAAACIIAINIYEENMEHNEFFKDIKSNDDIETMKELNTSIWNNHEVVDASGYSIDTLTTCLTELCVYIRQNLQPVKL